MDTYFDLIPIELNYIILNDLDYISFNKFTQIVGINFNYEVLFQIRYPILYFHVKGILADDKNLGNRFVDYLDVIFRIIYKDLLRLTDPKFNSDVPDEDVSYLIQSIYTGDVGIRSSYSFYRQKFNSITTDVLDLVVLKREHPNFYQKIKWFPIYIGTIYLISDFIETTKDYINEMKGDPTAAQLYELDNINNIEKYIDTGKLKERVVVNDEVISSLADFRSYIILIYLLVSEYLYNDGNILFNRREFVASEPEFEDPNYVDYRLHESFYDDLLNFINANKDELRYI